MRITHVFRGDEHVNNTPWQINIFNALGAPLPVFGARADHPRRRRAEALEAARRGQRHGVRRGRLPARGDAQLPGAPRLEPRRRGAVQRASSWSQWFDGSHLSKSPAQWDAGQARLGQRALPEGHARRCAGARSPAAQLARRGIVAPSTDAVLRACAVFKDRCSTGAELADWLAAIFGDVAPSAEDLALHVTDAVRPALATLRDKLATVSSGARRRSPPRSRRRSPRTA